MPSEKTNMRPTISEFGLKSVGVRSLITTIIWIVERKLDLYHLRFYFIKSKNSLLFRIFLNTKFLNYIIE